MVRVLLQAGHSAAFQPFQHGGGGAPGEADWTADLARRIAAKLRGHGVEVAIVGAWALDNSNPPPVVREDHDLFVSLHYDADIYPVRTGCFAGRATQDPQKARSDRALVAWKTIYPAATGIALHEERMNPNVTDYYAFRVTSDNTPGILIEHGVGQGNDHATLFDRIDTIAGADAQAILTYLGIGASDVTPEQQRILDAAARNGLDDAGIDNMVGINRLLGEQKTSLEELLRTSQGETAAQAAEAERLRQLVTTQAGAGVKRVEITLDDDRVEVLSR